MSKFLSIHLSAILSLLWIGTVLEAQGVRGDTRIFRPQSVYLGVEIWDVDPTDVPETWSPQEAGIFLKAVHQGTPAASPGLNEGNVLVEYPGMPVLGVRQLQQLVAETPPGREIPLTLIPNGTRIQARIRSRSRRATRYGRHLSDTTWQEELESFDLQIDLEKLSLFYSGRLKLGIVVENLTEQLGDFLGVPG